MIMEFDRYHKSVQKEMLRILYIIIREGGEL